MTVKKRTNWLLWVGFITAIVALLSYPFFFASFPITRDIPWANYLIFALGAFLLTIGLRRAFAATPNYTGKIAGPILALLSFLILAFFSYETVIASRQLPVALGAPHVGQKAPEFSLMSTDGKTLSLADLLSAPIADSSGAAHPPKGVLLIFYRGYW